MQKEAAYTGKSVEELKELNLVTGEVDKKFALTTGSAGSGALKINITNVLSRTYGIEIQGNDRRMHIFNMLMINDKLPATRTETFYTAANNQAAIDIKIYESRSTDEHMEIEGRTPLTEIEMKFRNMVPKDTPVIMTTALDNSGILHIIAEEQMGHSRLDTTFQLSNQMSDEDMRSAAIRMNSAAIE